MTAVKTFNGTYQLAVKSTTTIPLWLKWFKNVSSFSTWMTGIFDDLEKKIFNVLLQIIFIWKKIEIKKWKKISKIDLIMNFC